MRRAATPEAAEVGFNATYLRDALVAIGTDTGTLELEHPLSPAVVLPDGGPDPTARAVVMPMRL